MPVIAFTFALAVACAIVFGLFPALHAARLDLQQTLRDGGREGSRRRRVIACAACWWWASSVSHRC